MDEPTFTLRQAAKQLNLTSSAIRFYCNRGLVHHVRRSRQGYRIFTAEQLDWLRILHRLRQAGFTMDQLRHFAKLHYSEDDTRTEQRALLSTQKRQLWQELQEIQQSIDFIERQEELLG